MMAAVVALSGCGDSGLFGRRHSELDCMERAIYFEANRSSREGMIAVGTVVMNRVNSAQYPRSVCAVVGQKNQFAPGVLSRKMPHVPQVRAAAVSVMRGERHPAVRNAMFFHTYGHRFSYDNMHYVLTAGGNAFYERRPRNMVTQPVPLPPRDRIGLGG
ncbi:MAG: cell wall hydrolase [Paracoccus sp. (in: a-proteobacteria)]|uniref:cell wall hydrolase n=1 Tax=Paracoccus sp. TaxID=267 RepID=UPI0026DF4CC1|nr:cell wall hydrolase [Paracoccus sp. (in: a-proteobacteria)]MDO5613381.1 cell wall hydrolase [Paracoccus sp. (in: a-proteobacteria)]